MSAVPRNATGEIPPARADDARLLGTLLEDAAAYQSGAHYRDLLAFVARMRRFSPYNAMLLHRQRPGLSYATTARDWRRRWRRRVTEDARPLVVLMPFGPVAFVYDVLDTEALPGAPELPRDAAAFPAAGEITKPALKAVMAAVEAEGIQIVEVDEGDWHAGRILRSGDAYTLKVNRNHPRPTRFTTLAHEIAHLYLGHLGKDAKRRIPSRRPVPERMREIERRAIQRDGLRGFARRCGCPVPAVQRLAARGAYPERGPHGKAMRAAVAESLAEEAARHARTMEALARVLSGGGDR